MGFKDRWYADDEAAPIIWDMLFALKLRERTEKEEDLYQRILKLVDPIRRSCACCRDKHPDEWLSHGGNYGSY